MCDDAVGRDAAVCFEDVADLFAGGLNKESGKLYGGRGCVLLVLIGLLRLQCTMLGRWFGVWCMKAPRYCLVQVSDA
jgi:hypothetical protein